MYEIVREPLVNAPDDIRHDAATESLPSLNTGNARERAAVVALVRRYGWNATSFQVLEPGYHYFARRVGGAGGRDFGANRRVHHALARARARTMSLVGCGNRQGAKVAKVRIPDLH